MAFRGDFCCLVGSGSCKLKVSVLGWGNLICSNCTQVAASEDTCYVTEWLLDVILGGSFSSDSAVGKVSLI